jgi:predicted component of type VI protein secretion system
LAHLVGESGIHQGKTFPIDPGLTIGREAHNTIAMPDNKKCSRDHAKVWREGPNKFAIADLGSTNGTLLNDEKVTRASLKDGDLVQIGDASFRFVMSEAEKPAPKPAAERPSLADVLKGKAPLEAKAAQATGAGSIEIKQRVLQYQKKAAGGSQAAWDVGQSAGGTKWVMILIALAVAAGLFYLVLNAV